MASDEGRPEKYVLRWFMETVEGEILDGPYKNKKELNRALAAYIKTYKYHPIVVRKMMDPSTFTQSEDYCERGYQTGRKGCRNTRRSNKPNK